MSAVFQANSPLGRVAIAVQEAGTKINTAVRELKRREDQAASWMQRFIAKEIEQRSFTRDAAYWDAMFPGLSPAERAERRIDRMLVRGTVAGVAAAAGASAAELMSMWTQGAATLVAAPVGIVSVGAEMLYTTALQIDLAFDLASIYGVPFARDDVGEISTMLALALGVDLVKEPTRHDKPGTAAATDETKPWRVMRQMQRDDFASQVGRALIQQSVLRHLVPVASVLVSATWNQIILRRFARKVHATVKERFAIVRACRAIELGDAHTTRAILDGAWLLATCDGEVEHQEAVALATLIDSLALPQRISVKEASFPDDEEPWFEEVIELEPRAREVLMTVLAHVAVADGDLSTPEKRFLRRLSKRLNMPIDIAAIEQLAVRLRDGDEAADAPVPLWTWTPPPLPSTSS
jgi:tellurite resistance protein